ncbi:unnamed protein product, partial [Rotaria sp. Silwood1]
TERCGEKLNENPQFESPQQRET